MADEFRSNLGQWSDDALSQYPSAANPLSIDELMKARAVNTPPPAAWEQGMPGAAASQPQGSGIRDQGSAAVQPQGPGYGAQGASAPAQTSVGTSARDYGMRGLGALEQNLGAATTAANQIPTSSPEADTLEQQRQKLAAPTPLRDAQGNILPQYKEGLGGKILRGVRGGVVGLLTGGIPGAVVGAIEPQDIAGGTAYGAPNKTYQRAETARQTNLASTDQSLQNAMANWKAATDAQKAKASEFRANASLGKDLTAGATSIMGEDVKALDTPAERNKQSLLMGQQQFDQRTGFANRMNLPPNMASYYVLNGKMPDPKQPREPSAEEMMLGGAMRAFRQQNGRAPNYQEYMGIVSGITGRGGMGFGGAPGSENLTGEDYLKTLPTQMSATVRAIGEGRIPSPSSSNRSQQAQALLGAVNQAYPGYLASSFPTFAAAQKNFTSGSIGTAINSFNTALRHLDALESHIPDNTGFSTLNAVENTLTSSGSERSQALAKFDADATAVANEVAKAYKGGVISEGEYNHMNSLLNRNDAPAKMRANIEEFRNLLAGKLESYRQQRATAAAGIPGAKSPLDPIGAAPEAQAPSGDWHKQFQEAK